MNTGQLFKNMKLNSIVTAILAVIYITALVPSRACSARPANRTVHKSASAHSNSRRDDRNDREKLARILKLAHRLINDGNLEEACRILEGIHTSHPESIRARILLAECYARSGMGEKAVEVLKKLQEENPGDFNFIKALGNAYLETGEREKAVETWEKMLTGNKGSASFYGVVARLESENGLYREAIETLRRGRKFERYFDRYTRQMIKLERITGRQEAAFRDALALLSGMKSPGLKQARFVLEIFRDSGRKKSLIPVVDSVAVAAGERRELFCLVKSLLLAEGGSFDRALDYAAGEEYSHRKAVIEGEGKDGSGTSCPRPDEDSMYSMIRFLRRLQPEDRAGFSSFKRELYSIFLEYYPGSPAAPVVLLEFARSQRERAMVCSPGAREDYLNRAITLADSALGDSRSVTFRGEVLYFKASILADDLNRPEEAVRVLEQVKPAGPGGMPLPALELLSDVLLVSGKWDRAEREFDRMTGSSDSMVVALGRYQLGQLAFVRGEFDQAVEKLSGFAREHTWSKWANDALDRSILLKRALNEENEQKGDSIGGKKTLELYRRAVMARERGDREKATADLSRITENYPSSSLAPVALYRIAEIKQESGQLEIAAEYFNRLSEEYLLHELAPGALERIAGIKEENESEEAMRLYQEIMKRYPDYPFMERIRDRYVALSKWMDSGEEAGGRPTGRGE